jgi:hypothetical protein
MSTITYCAIHTKNGTYFKAHNKILSPSSILKLITMSLATHNSRPKGLTFYICAPSLGGIDRGRLMYQWDSNERGERKVQLETTFCNPVRTLSSSLPSILNRNLDQYPTVDIHSRYVEERRFASRRPLVLRYTFPLRLSLQLSYSLYYTLWYRSSTSLPQPAIAETGQAILSNFLIGIQALAGSEPDMYSTFHP